MSNLATLARPYAKAAFDLARAQDALAAWDEALAASAAAVSETTMARWLESPGLDRSSAATIVADAVIGEGDPAFRRYLEVLAANDRLALLPEVALAFGRLREAAENRLKVRVISAVPLEPDQTDRMGAALKQRFQCDIELENEVDAGVLGGAVIYAGDQVIDGSLKGRLANLASSLA
jgi:F-type H+-transporting ATPase subunit delta